jgi:hypothetical protein
MSQQVYVVPAAAAKMLVWSTPLIWSTIRHFEPAHCTLTKLLCHTAKAYLQQLYRYAHQA